MSHDVPISGQIDPKSFPYLLMDLHRNAATGSLKVDGPTYQKALYFRGGRILFGSSNDPRDQLGAILIEGGKIAPEQLEDINAKVGPGSPLAKVLADSGFVNQRELSEAARAKVEQILSDVLGYASGSFEFEDGVLPKGAVDLKLSTEKLVLAAVRRVNDRAFVLRHLGSLEVVLAPLADPRSLLAEIQADLGGLIDVLDGETTLKEAAAQTRLDEFEAAKIACALLFLSLVERTDAKAQAAPILAPQPQPSRAKADANRTMELVIEEPMERTLVDEPLSDPAVFALPPDTPPIIVIAPRPEPAPVPPPEPAPVTPRAEPWPEPAPTLIGSAPTLISRVPEIPLPAPEPRVEPRPAIDPRRGTGPSASDMAAVDALLNSRVFEGPLEPMEKSTEPQRWQARPDRGGRRSPSEGSRRGLVAAALLAIAVLGAGAWFVLLRPKGPSPVTVEAAPPRPVPPPPSTTPPAVTPTLPSEPPATATTPPTLRETPAPKPSPREAPAGARSLEDARALMLRGRLTEAADAFAGHIRGMREAHTIQILVACSDDTVQKAVTSASAQELYILPVHYKGKNCYRLCWGIYDDDGRARSAVGTVPEYFRKGGASPKVVRTSGILP